MVILFFPHEPIQVGNTYNEFFRFTICNYCQSQIIVVHASSLREDAF